MNPVSSVFDNSCMNNISEICIANIFWEYCKQCIAIWIVSLPRLYHYTPMMLQLHLSDQRFYCLLRFYSIIYFENTIMAIDGSVLWGTWASAMIASLLTVPNCAWLMLRQGHQSHKDSLFYLLWFNFCLDFNIFFTYRVHSRYEQSYCFPPFVFRIVQYCVISDCNILRVYQLLKARLEYLQCISNGDTPDLH